MIKHTLMGAAVALCLIATPALAMAHKQADPSTVPVPAADAAAWHAWVKNITLQVSLKGGFNDPDYNNMMEAVTVANGAIEHTNNAQFQYEKGVAEGYASKLCGRIGGC